MFNFFEKFDLTSFLGDLYIDNLKYRQNEFHETISLENLINPKYVNMFNYLQEHNQNFKKKYFELNFYVKTTQAYAQVAIDIATNNSGANRFAFLADYLNYSKSNNFYNMTIMHFFITFAKIEIYTFINKISI